MITELVNKTIAIAVQKDANHFRLDGNMLQWFAKEDGQEQSQLQMLPDGQYTLIGISDEMSEGACAKIVDKEELFINGNSEGVRYKDYYGNPDDVCEWYNQSDDSFQSLLKSKQLTGRYAILKKD